MTIPTEAPWFKRLQEEIDKTDMSYRELSLRAGFGENFVNQLMRGTRVPSVVNMLRLCEAIGVSPATILTGTVIDRETMALFHAFNRLPPDQRRTILDLMRSIVRSEAGESSDKSSA